MTINEHDSDEQKKVITEVGDVPPSGHTIFMPIVEPPAKSDKEDESPSEKEEE